MDNTAHSLDYAAAIRRRRWWLIAPIVGSVIVGAALLALLPKEYEAAATLGVKAPAVSPTLVNQSASFDNQERLRALRLQLLSDAVLARVVAEEAGVTGDAATPMIGNLRATSPCQCRTRSHAHSSRRSSMRSASRTSQTTQCGRSA
jgi:uncharacterized protein involved in exopolysaccharide biosynthesis